MKDTTKRILTHSLAFLGGVIATLAVILGIGLATTLTASEISYTSKYTSKQPKKSGYFDGIHEEPYLVIPKNRTDVDIIVPFRVTGDYIITEEGYPATAIFTFHAVDENGIAIFLGNGLVTNDSEVYEIDTNFYKCEMSVYATGPIFLCGYDGSDQNSIYYNNTHYYQVPTIIYQNGGEIERIECGEAYELPVWTTNWSFTQLYTTLEPYSNVYPSVSKWYGMANYTESNPLVQSTFTIGTIIDRTILWQSDYQPMTTSIKNSTMRTMQVSQTRTGDWEYDDAVYAIDLPIEQTYYFREQNYIWLESKAPFYLTRKTSTAEQPATPTKNGTYELYFQTESGAKYEVKLGTIGENNSLNNIFWLFSMVFTSISGLLGIRVFGTFTIAMILAIPLIVTLVIALMRMVKK